jgi:HPt (histidine-containing phosphotransfer) domain-containing protein
VARERFDVVLMDVQMPVLDGIEATRLIRALPRPASEVLVFALSAGVSARERERYLAAGMNDALTKPIDWPQLFEALATYGSPGATGREAAHLPARQPSLAPVAAATPHTVSPIDTAVLDRLRRLQGGTDDLIAKLSEIFARVTGRRLEELGDAVRRGDAPAVVQLAHAIKGSAANLGAQIVAQICADIETRAEAADLSSASAQLDELRREFARACDALTAKPLVA